MKIDVKDKKSIQEKITELTAIGSIFEDEKAFVFIELLIKKANNNLKLAKIVFDISSNSKQKANHKLLEGDSFYDWVIITSYYAMFHITHSLLATKKIRIRNIRVHEATLYAFAHHFILTKELEDDLFLMYEDAEARANQLFNELSEEKQKRGQFTYERLPKANKEPAEESLNNAIKFVRDIESIVRKRWRI